MSIRLTNRQPQREPTAAEWVALDSVNSATDLVTELARVFLTEWDAGDGGDADTCDATDALRGALSRYDSALEAWEAANVAAVATEAAEED